MTPEPRIAASVPDGSGAVVRGMLGVFTLRPRDGWYDLPALEVLGLGPHGARLQRLKVDVEDAPSLDLDMAVQAAVERVALPEGVVRGRVRLPAVRLPAEAISRPCDLRLRFRLVCQDADPADPAYHRMRKDMSLRFSQDPVTPREQRPADVPEARHEEADRTRELRFDHANPPRQEAYGPNDATQVMWRPQARPSRDVRQEPPEAPPADQEQAVAPRERPEQVHQGYAALDFGTSQSTVTLLDRWRPTRSAFPPSQTEVLRREALVLLTPAPPGLPRDCEEEWLLILDTLADRMDVYTGAGDSDDRLRALLNGEAGIRGDNLHRMLLELEDIYVYRDDDEIRDWLALRLHRAYDAAFSAPALDRWDLHRVVLDSAKGGKEIASRVEVRQSRPLTVRVGDSVLAVASGDAAGDVFLGLKQKLNEFGDHTLADGTAVSTLDLIGAAYKDLIERTDAFIAASPDRLGSGGTDQVIITYPTMAGPGVRASLERVARERLGMSDVEMRFDEAVAAAFFFLMRDLGGDPATGIEALRARSRRLGEGLWRHNMLVVDIGGGTTDIALLALTLRDETPVLPGVEPGKIGRSGRYWRIIPSLLGAGGDTQHGGDHLTLEVFHWLKTAFAERVLSVWGERGTVASMMDLLDEPFGRPGTPYRTGALLEHAVEQVNAIQTLAPLPKQDAATKARHAQVERAVPTHWEEDADRRALFDALWRLAEKTKHELGAAIDGRPGEPYTLDESDVDEVVVLLERAHPGPGGDQLGPISLDSSVFQRLATKHVEDVCALATEVARGRLGGQPLDRLILTGNATRLPLVTGVFAERFGRDEQRQLVLARLPKEVTVEREYAKHATSVGACFAKHLRAFVHDRPKHAADLLLRGDTVIYVDVDNLFLELPCGFQRVLQGDVTAPVMDAGESMHVLGDGHRTRIRRETGALTETYQVERDGLMTWMQFKYLEYLEKERKERLIPAGWQHDRSVWVGQSAEIHTAFEIDERLLPTLHLWRGERPHYTIDETPVCHLDSDTAGARQAPLDRLTGDIVVSRGHDVQSDGLPLFSATREGEPSPFTETFHLKDGSVRKGMIAGPLPPPIGGAWTIEFWPNGSADRPEALGTVKQLTQQRGAAHYVSLDDAGELRLHLAEPAYREAANLKEVEDTPGAVRSYQVVQHRDTDWQESRHPFSGRQ
ncbi:hypothetical protein [Sinosporangium siamense]|uniref:Uncharacterized protein n=1 Tax=Sinosporangium siamense TaxID=1367973 RepID=A0A919RB32_9ACTN|nr:hypothetical protein [Sinosporangium siamense]GII90655.1 hypothetical protein Ssi02_08860 [Sinosporangium siamense]